MTIIGSSFMLWCGSMMVIYKCYMRITLTLWAQRALHPRVRIRGGMVELHKPGFKP
jgi:hypothetical protein